jgi:hypothetical protein
MLDDKDERVAGRTEACRLFDAQVADYLEGEHRPAVVVHARECAFCGVILADLQAVISESTALSFEDPPARLWSNIRATLEAEGVIRKPGRWWAARWFSRLAPLPSPAAVGALALLVVVAFSLRVSPDLFRPRPAPTALTAKAHEETVALRTISGEDAALTATVTELENSYQARKASFEPADKDTYERSLVSLNKSIREAQDSVNREPDDALAREYLVAAYEQKAEVLSAALEYDGR